MTTRSHHYGTFANVTTEDDASPTCVTEPEGKEIETGIATMARQSEEPSKNGGTDVALAEAIQHEHELSFWQAARMYPKAVGWSAYVSIGVVMLAFDPQIVGNMFAMPQFQKDFGYELDGEVCSLSLP